MLLHHGINKVLRLDVADGIDSDAYISEANFDKTRTRTAVRSKSDLKVANVEQARLTIGSSC